MGNSYPPSHLLAKKAKEYLQDPAQCLPRGNYSVGIYRVMKIYKIMPEGKGMGINNIKVPSEYRNMLSEPTNGKNQEKSCPGWIAHLVGA